MLRLLTLLVTSTVFCTQVCAEPLVIAHRGASGYLPEHTLEAYATAHAMGADYIEPDLVLTKDGHFICLHDIHLEGTTNVEEVFPGRKRDDDRWYPVDFTLAEIKRLQVHERLADRFPAMKSDFEVPTLVEMIEMVQGLNKTTGKNVGIYPELKGPSFHAKEGQPMEEALLSVLKKYGYDQADSKIFVQCFEVEPLRKMRNELGSKLPQVMLIGNGAAAKRLLSPEGLKDLATFVNGIGPSKGLIEKDPTIVKKAHKHKLVVHPYTFRADSYPKKSYDSFEKEVDQFFNKYEVDGVFTDFPDQVAQFLNR
jgi:glycerophosphoryl diester phosphodiesterase